MTITSSLNASVAGLNVNASRLATISDNISNSGTYGYKRAETEFSAMVASPGSGAYTAGGVAVSTSRAVASEGAVVTTNNALDIAVGGGGMLPVTPVTSIDAASTELKLMPTGSFERDETGLLRTKSGFALLGWELDENQEPINQLRDSVTGLVPVQISSGRYVASPTTQMDLGINLPAEDTRFDASGDPLTVPIEYFDNLGSSETLTATFTPTIPGAGSSNEWTLELNDSATAGASNPIATFTLTFDDTRGSGGSLLDVTVSGGAATYDVASGVAEVNVNGGPLDITIGPYGTGSSLTQLAADFAPAGISKNGNRAGILTGLEIDADGYLNATFDTGLSRKLYQIPVANVSNPNGLEAQEAQTFAVTADSGPFYLWDSGSGPAGVTNGYALQSSSTDLAKELTSLIETQRAYSSNAKVVQTVDDMLQETTNIKR